MNLAPLIEVYSTALVAVAIAVVAALALIPVRNREVRRGLVSTLVAMAVFLGLRLLRAGVESSSPHLADYVKVAGLLVFAWGVLRLASSLVFDLLVGRSSGRHSPKIVRQVAFGVVYVLVLVAILRSVLEIDLASLLATSAVLSLVLGLALQDTLGNLFAGLSLQAEKPFEVGDWVTFGTFAGRIMQVGWRTTQIEDFAHDLISVPNNVIAREAITNHSRPSTITGVRLDLGLSYEAPPNRVKEVVLGVLRDDPAVRADPEPMVRLTGFADSSVTYLVRFWVDTFEQRYTCARPGERHPLVPPSPGGPGDPLPHPHGEAPHRGRRGPPAARATAGRQDIERYLAGSELLAPLGVEGQRVLAERSREVVFGDGERVFGAGDEGDRCYLVLSGGARMLGDDGEVVARIGPGEIFGEGALLTGTPRSATMAAEGDTVLLEIGRAAFREVLLANEQVAAELAAILEKRQAARKAAGQPTGHAGATVNGNEAAGLMRRIRDIFGLGR